MAIHCHKQSCMALVLLCALASSSPALSQQVRRYQPANPTISPYINLTRLNNSSVPNYYSVVRPQQRQRQFNLQEQAFRQQQARTLGRIESDLRFGQTSMAATGIGSRFMTSGERSTFLDTGRYYPQTTLGRRRR